MCLGEVVLQAFEGLRLLPTSAVIRTALCEHPLTGRAALLLSADALARVLRALTVQDARRVLDRLAEETPAGNTLGCFQAIWSVWETGLREASRAKTEWHHALYLYLEASRVTVDVVDHRCGQRRSHCYAWRCLANLSALHGHTLLTALAAVTWRLSIKSLAPQMRKPWSRCATVRRRGYTMWGRHCARIIPVRQENKPHTHTGAALHGVWGFFCCCHSSTPYHSQRPRTAGQRWRKLSRVALLRFLLLVKCCGQPRARRVFSDPLLRDLMGIPPALSLTSVHHWQAGISATHRRTFLETLAAWHSERGAIHGAPTILARVAAPGSPHGDCDGRRAWDRLWASGYHPRQPARLLPSLQRWLMVDTQAETPLLSDAVFLATLSLGWPSRMIISPPR